MRTNKKKKAIPLYRVRIMVENRMGKIVLIINVLEKMRADAWNNAM
jgi:hypothetical protein